MIHAHNERVARLSTIYSSGVIELRWTDRKGKHFEQGDLDFWRAPHDQTALRVSKVGQVFLWLGSNAQEYWLFDLLSKDDRVLYRGTHADADERLGAFGISPLALLDLLGLTPIDDAPGDEENPRYDGGAKAWVLDAIGRGGNMRLFFHRSTLLPIRVESLGSGGEIVAESTLARHEAVYLPNTAIMARPKLAELIDIRPGKAGNGEFSGEVKIAINETTGDVDTRQLERVFDLATLIKSMRPDRTEDIASAQR